MHNDAVIIKGREGSLTDMRTVKCINENWCFTKEGKSENVNLPHTWNGFDGQDGGGDYYRGVCSYEKILTLKDFPPGDEIWLQLDGVNASASVYFNGEMLGSHDGGYSTFRMRLPAPQKRNVLRIEADNGPNGRVYPQKADFTFYGGIYRDVTLIGVPRQHFDLGHCGAPGISVIPVQDGTDYIVTLTAYCTGTVQFTILDGETVIGTAASDGTNPSVTITIPNAHLWNGRRDPYLYTATASLLLPADPADGTSRIEDETAVDEVSLRFGCRSFSIDPQRGFVLNGESYPLHGVSRHQDRPDIGNALLPAHHLEDMDLICEMGANAIRLAHYQHAQYFYDLCDERGMVVWAEIPYISAHMSGGVGNTYSQMKELILQNAHHASIITWGLSNEITMGDDMNGMTDNHRMLNDLVHELDPSRPTTLAAFTTCSIDEPYIHISDVLAYNHYFGWYGGRLDEYGPWFDTFHRRYPDTAIGLSEYGAEALNWHNSHPEQGDYSEEYQAIYHEAVIPQLLDRPWIWGTFVWNMFDFAADGRSEGGKNGMNHKGLVTFDRKYKKDSFYIYQAYLSESPMLHICSKRYVDRVEDVVEVKVYSNQPEVELFANGVSVGKQQKNAAPIFRFRVLNEGETLLRAQAGKLSDESRIRKVETFNEDYRLKEAGTVLNWFEITAPEGYFSLNDTVGDLCAAPEGRRFVGGLMERTKKSGGEKKKADSGTTHTVSDSTMKLIMSFTVKRAIAMSGVKLSKEELLAINAQLNRIRKP